MKPCEGPGLLLPKLGVVGMPCILVTDGARFYKPIINFKDDDLFDCTAYDHWLDSLPLKERKRRGLT